MNQFARVHPTDDKDSTVYTDPRVADGLHQIITSQYDFQIIFDPCIGTGSLVWPWRLTSEIVGVDIDLRPAIADVFRKCDFTSIKRFDLQPDLVICNPPFNGSRAMMWPERFLRKIIDLFGPSVPIAMIVPVGFRFNMRWKTKRRQWLKHEAPKITTIVSLPIDAFRGVTVCSEVVMFNMPKLDAHFLI